MKQCCSFGTYRHCINIVPPWVGKRLTWDGVIVGIDRCVLPEIIELWNAGIKTVASCCGHGKIAPSVVVDDASVEKMLKFGYKNNPQAVKQKEDNPEACDPASVFLLTSMKRG